MPPLTLYDLLRREKIQPMFRVGGDSGSSGGGGTPEQITPYPLALEATGDTSLGAEVIKVGQDANRFRIYSDSDRTTLVSEIEQAGNFYLFTGLTQSTQYWVSVAAKFGTNYSADLEATGWTLVTPLHAYNFQGIGYSQTNSFGKTGSPGTVTDIMEVYSHRGTANTLTPVTATRARIVTQFNTTQINKQSANTVAANRNLYQSSSPIDLGTGNFTILFQTAKNNLSTGFIQILAKSFDDANTTLTSNNASSRFRAVTGTVGQYQTTYPATLGSHNNQRLCFKRVGTSFYCGIVNDDDTVSWGAAVTNANIALSTQFDRIFTGSDFWYVSVLNFYTSELTDAQIAREFNAEKKAAYPFAALNKTLAPKGVTWNDLSLGYFIDADTSYAATAGASWSKIYTIGDYTYIGLSEKDTLSTNFGLIYNHLTGQRSNKIPFFNYHTIADGHNVDSIFILDNTLYTFGADIHYDKTVPTNLKITRFGNEYLMTEQTILRAANGIVSHMGSFFQYPQAIKTANYLHVICQEYAAGAFWITDLRFKDNGNSCEKIRLAYTGGTNWFYHTVIHSEDDIIRVCLHYLLIGATDRYKHTFYIESVNNGDTWRNKTQTASKAIGTNQASLTIAELEASYLMTHDGTADTNDNRVTSAYYDPTDDTVYACSVDGAGALNFIKSTGTDAFAETAIDLLSRNIVGTYGEAGSIGHGTNIPTIVRDGANAYRLLCQEIVSGSIWKGALLSTVDGWTNSVDGGDFTNDDTTLHDRIMVTRNVHHTGGADAYNEKRLLVCSREQTSPDNHSDTFFYEL